MVWLLGWMFEPAFRSPGKGKAGGGGKAAEGGKKGEKRKAGEGADEGKPRKKAKAAAGGKAEAKTPTKPKSKVMDVTVCTFAYGPVAPGAVHSECSRAEAFYMASRRLTWPCSVRNVPLWWRVAASAPQMTPEERIAEKARLKAQKEAAKKAEKERLAAEKAASASKEPLDEWWLPAATATAPPPPAPRLRLAPPTAAVAAVAAAAEGGAAADETGLAPEQLSQLLTVYQFLWDQR